MNICQSDWFNKKKNGQYLARILGPDRTLGRRRTEMQNHQADAEEALRALKVKVIEPCKRI